MSEMKTIEVTDEMYEFLMNLSKEIKEQDNRCTAMPYFFQVRETKEVAAHRGCGTEVMYSSGYETELRTDKEKIEWIKENFELFDGKGYGDECDWILDEMLDSVGFEVFNVDVDYEYSNVFFTSKACDEHIRINRHNLKQPVSFIQHAFRNQEMEMIFKFLIGLYGKL